MMELLRLSESRMGLLGGVAIDTLCMGTLALMLLQPALFGEGHTGSIALAALAITAPVLASTAALIGFALPDKMDVEERVRRTVMAAAVLHGGVQLAMILEMMCDEAPRTVTEYFLHSWLVASGLAITLLFVGICARFLRTTNKRAQAPAERVPPARL